MKKVPLVDLAKTIRSKNAGVDHITFDIIFRDREVYEYIKQNQLITKEMVAQIYNISPEKIVLFVYFDPAKAIKFTIRRSKPSGSPGETDVMGAQQYPPLFEISLTLPESLLKEEGGGSKG
ncbi:hypothetical protein OCC_11894 [Thermococcus litoralis DSM 5473]|jgi:hypothetical protein|uniref:DUF4387 domain-containing protein n=1 Tax=Thermococcus litoralis (strain ATCC 51850 / DSM 5473 / JCM 8560 / NS-C) TaxID=523849 RepID=H3ZNZ4_THELN|nr:DUF4387 domain-containing protein [Thermococcus litoralis]EHR78335.1 hypothetical protein OCC_11894 [Thermococcus litoralis DSM 5473]